MLIDENDGVSSFQGAWLGAPGLRIAGGTDEILRNVIAERVLAGGLQRLRYYQTNQSYHYYRYYQKI